MALSRTAHPYRDRIKIALGEHSKKVDQKYIINATVLMMEKKTYQVEAFLLRTSILPWTIK